MKKILLLVCVVGGVWYFLQERQIKHPPGVLVAEAPRQNNISSQQYEFAGYRIENLAEFELKARILAKKRYWLGRESDLSKYDLTLGWGPMSDSAVLDRIEISQSGRWYYWRTEQFPIPRRDIERNSANMHMIAATDWVEDRIADGRVGDVIQLRGYLVKITATDGWRWQSSLTRDDTGNHACELIFVEEFEIL